jgi:hypothetical protein
MITNGVSPIATPIVLASASPTAAPVREQRSGGFRTGGPGMAVRTPGEGGMSGRGKPPRRRALLVLKLAQPLRAAGRGNRLQHASINEHGCKQTRPAQPTRAHVGNPRSLAISQAGASHADRPFLGADACRRATNGQRVEGFGFTSALCRCPRRGNWSSSCATRSCTCLPSPSATVR